MSESLTQRYEDLKKKLAELGKDVEGEIKRLMGEGKAFSPAGALYALSRSFEIEYGSPTTVRGVWVGGCPDSFGKTRKLLMKKGGLVIEARDHQGDIQKFAVVAFEGARQAVHKPSGRTWLDLSQAKSAVTAEPNGDQLRAHAALPKQIPDEETLIGVVGTVAMVATGNIYQDGKRTEQERDLFFTDKNGRERMHLKLMLLSDGQNDTDPNSRVNVNLMWPEQLTGIYPEQIPDPAAFLKRLKESPTKDPVYNAIGALTDELIFAVGRAGKTMGGGKELREITTPFVNIDGGMVVNIGLTPELAPKQPRGMVKTETKPQIGATLTGVDAMVFAEFEKNEGGLDGDGLRALSKRENVDITLIQDVIQRAYLAGKVKKDGKRFVYAK